MQFKKTWYSRIFLFFDISYWCMSSFIIMVNFISWNNKRVLYGGLYKTVQGSEYPLNRLHLALYFGDKIKKPDILDFFYFCICFRQKPLLIYKLSLGMLQMLENCQNVYFLRTTFGKIWPKMLKSWNFYFVSMATLCLHIYSICIFY